MTLVFGNRFRLIHCIGSGSFGEIYVAEDGETSNIVALKLEPMTTKVQQLQYEAKVYQFLQGGVNIPKFYWYGNDRSQNVMAFERLSKSVENLFNYKMNYFSLKTVLMLADQMISAIEYMHKKGFIHRDIKTENFMMGMNEKASQLYLIDFGLAGKYKNSSSHVTSNNSHATSSNTHVTSNNSHAKSSNSHVTSNNSHAKSSNSHVTSSNSHITSNNSHATSNNAPIILVQNDENEDQTCVDYNSPQKPLKNSSQKNEVHKVMTKNHEFIGTAKFQSINAHLGYSLSRRDDMEAIGYILVYLMKGSLPWMDIKTRDKKLFYEYIKTVKINTPIDQLCNGLPNEFAEYLKSVRNLEFEEEPKYSIYRKMFRDLFIRNVYVYDYQYDWTGKDYATPIEVKLSEQKNWLQNYRAQMKKTKQTPNKIGSSPLNSLQKNAQTPNRKRRMYNDSLYPHGMEPPGMISGRALSRGTNGSRSSTRKIKEVRSANPDNFLTLKSFQKS
ncbi:hypothetical protein TRFO_31507 [Tritrichomonas foetus]|uniref:non-specific serine/threonine protein kinase n=1 Tax=Tritrichomonas foetus TaxID=1144522 RepID=A0A1J4JT74_9EUKA|nr:hypothetical protein TRFO_31507 [Tritrichomonas foetus]|eukprot:OHT01632.1 hypothetical protein TRFO_31507 [Tritrichomonas foetus]